MSDATIAIVKAADATKSFVASDLVIPIRIGEFCATRAPYFLVINTLSVTFDRSIIPVLKFFGKLPINTSGLNCFLSLRGNFAKLAHGQCYLFFRRSGACACCIA